jgi:hypothetical protein
MRFWLIIIAFVFPAFAAQAQGIANITIRVVPEGVSARVQLSQPTREFQLAPRDIERVGNLEVKSARIRFEGDSFKSYLPFRQFDVLVRATTKEFDGKYAPLRPFGEGRIFHTDTLVGVRSLWRTRYTYVLPRGFVSTAKSYLSQNGHVFIGPRTYLRDRGNFVTVVAPGTPTFLEAMVVSDFQSAITTYTQLLRHPLSEKPIAMIQTNAGGSGFTGDMAPGPTAYFRFNGPGWDQPNPRWREGVKSFVAHEVFHFWNGGVVSSEGEAAWLHEGSAEYAAIMVVAKDAPDLDQFIAAALQQRLQWCASSLRQMNDPAIDKLDFIPSGVRYPCGVVMMWAADLKMRRDGEGRSSFFDTWAEIVRLGMARPTRKYTIEDFTKIVDPATSKSVEVIQLLREETGPARFTKVVAALRAGGATIESAPSVYTRLEGVFVHLLKQSCGSTTGFGYSINGRTLTLDSNEGCGILKGSPTIALIEGVDPMTISQQVYAGFQAKCSLGKPLQLTVLGGQILEVPCQSALVDAEASDQVSSWRPKPVTP